MASTRLQENNYLGKKNDHNEREKKDQTNFVHGIPFVYVTAIHWQSNPVIEYEPRTIVTMHLGWCPMAKRSHLPGQTDEYEEGKHITLSANL